MAKRSQDRSRFFSPISLSRVINILPLLWALAAFAGDQFVLHRSESPMKKTRYQKDDRRRRQERRLTKERSPGGIRMPQPLAGGTPVRVAAKASSLPHAPLARTQDQASGTEVTDIEEAIPAGTKPATHIDSASAQLNRGRGNEGVADKPASLDAAAPTNADGAVNGELLPIDSLQSLAPEEREIVRQSEVAFVRVRATWECWKQVRAGLVVLRDLAMREAGANDPKSKLYKDRFHELLEQRAYCSGKMEPSTRKALLKCAELASQIDEWHDRLGEHRRLRLNHPVSVLNAFRKSQEPPSSPDQPRRTKHELELEKVRQEAVAAVSSRDERIIELQQQIDSLSKPVETFEAAESDIDTAVQYVVAMCGGADIKIRQVINALTACLEHSPS